MYKSNFSVVKKDSDRSALVNVKARPTDDPTPHTYTTSFIPTVWSYLLLLRMSIVIIFVLKGGHPRLALLRADMCHSVLVIEGLRAPPSLELIVPLNFCLFPCSKTMWGLSDLFLLICSSTFPLSLSPSLSFVLADKG